MPPPPASLLLRTFAVASLALACLCSPVLAVPGISGISARPIAADGTPLRGAYFDLAREAGSTYVGSVEIRNSTDAPIPVHVSAVDATTSTGGGTAFLSRGAPVRGVGAWISPARQPLTLGAASATRLRFEVRVPPNAPPGDHVGGLAIEPIRQSSVRSTEAITRVIRLVLAVRVRVKGDAPAALVARKLRVEPAADAPPTLTVELVNDGALLCKPALTAALAQDGAVVSAEHRSIETVLPNTAADIPIRWSRPVADGTYDAEVRAEGCGAPSVVRERVVIDHRATRLASAVPGANRNRPRADGATGIPAAFQLAGLIAGVLAAAGLGWWIARRPGRHRRRAAPSSP